MYYDYKNNASIEDGSIKGIKDNAIGELTLEEIRCICDVVKG